MEYPPGVGARAYSPKVIARALVLAVVLFAQGVCAGGCCSGARRSSTRPRQCRLGQTVRPGWLGHAAPEVCHLVAGAETTSVSGRDAWTFASTNRDLPRNSAHLAGIKLRLILLVGVDWIQAYEGRQAVGRVDDLVKLGEQRGAVAVTRAGALKSGVAGAEIRQRRGTSAIVRAALQRGLDDLQEAVDVGGQRCERGKRAGVAGLLSIESQYMGSLDQAAHRTQGSLALVGVDPASGRLRQRTRDRRFGVGPREPSATGQRAHLLLLCPAAVDQGRQHSTDVIALRVHDIRQGLASRRLRPRMP